VRLAEGLAEVYIGVRGEEFFEVEDREGPAWEEEAISSGAGAFEVVFADAVATEMAESLGEFVIMVTRLVGK